MAEKNDFISFVDDLKAKSYFKKYEKLRKRMGKEDLLSSKGRKLVDKNVNNYSSEILCENLLKIKSEKQRYELLLNPIVLERLSAENGLIKVINSFSNEKTRYELISKTDIYNKQMNGINKILDTFSENFKKEILSSNKNLSIYDSLYLISGLESEPDKYNFLNMYMSKIEENSDQIYNVIQIISNFKAENDKINFLKEHLNKLTKYTYYNDLINSLSEENRLNLLMDENIYKQIDSKQINEFLSKIKNDKLKEDIIFSLLEKDAKNIDKINQIIYSINDDQIKQEVITNENILNNLDVYIVYSILSSFKDNKSKIKTALNENVFKNIRFYDFIQLLESIPKNELQQILESSPELSNKIINKFGEQIDKETKKEDMINLIKKIRELCPMLITEKQKNILEDDSLENLANISEDERKSKEKNMDFKDFGMDEDIRKWYQMHYLEEEKASGKSR